MNHHSRTLFSYFFRPFAVFTVLGLGTVVAAATALLHYTSLEPGSTLSEFLKAIPPQQSAALETFDAGLHHALLRGLVIVTGILLLAAGAAVMMFSLSLRRLTSGLALACRKLKEGDLTVRLDTRDCRELDDLSTALNTVLEAAQRKLENAKKQRSEHELILTSMLEGVIALDRDEKVFECNTAARDLLHLDHLPLGKSVQEIVRSAELHEAVRQLLDGRTERSELEIALLHLGSRRLRVAAAALRDETGRPSGALLVLHDLTVLRQLETLRSAFVANVSHELKTPITSIKGFSEALIDGALEEPERARHFLDIIHRQAERMNAIVDDLLYLSQLEAAEANAVLEGSVKALRPIIESVVEMCASQAARKNIELRILSDPSISCYVNEALMEQVLVNLIDNAIKYCREGDLVEIETVEQDSQIGLSVRDTGPGIPSEHLERIFERFYRLEKDRGRRSGGTGLGLAIVKHIAQLHGGTVRVESEVGRGSTFSVLLPLPRERAEGSDPL